MKDKSMKSKNIIDSMKYAISGLKYGFINTKNLHIDLVVAFFVILFGFILKVSLFEWLILLLCITIVISLEFINTAIEEAVNLSTNDIHPLAKASKDVAAGAVLFSAIMSAIIGLIIFIPKLIDLF